MKLLPLKDILGKSKEILDEAMAPIRARQARSRADLEVSKIDEELLTLEVNTQELCSKKEINFPAILDNIDKSDLLERRKRKYEEVLLQLFPTE